MKVRVHDGIGVRLAARRLNIDKITWSNDAASTLALRRTQFDAQVLCLPWQRVGDAAIIRVIGQEIAGLACCNGRMCRCAVFAGSAPWLPAVPR